MAMVARDYPQRFALGMEHKWRVYAGGNDHVIHPGGFLDITNADVTVNSGQQSLPDMIVEYIVAADGQPTTAGRQVVPGDQLLKLGLERIGEPFSL